MPATTMAILKWNSIFIHTSPVPRDFSRKNKNTLRARTEHCDELKKHTCFCKSFYSCRWKKQHDKHCYFHFQHGLFRRCVPLFIWHPAERARFSCTAWVGQILSGESTLCSLIMPLKGQVVYSACRWRLFQRRLLQYEHNIRIDDACSMSKIMTTNRAPILGVADTPRGDLGF